MKTESESPVALFTRAIERWENEGGQVAEFGRKGAANPGSVPESSTLASG